MNQEQIAGLLDSMKLDLGMLNTTSYDERFKQLLQVSYEQIQAEGATLNLNVISDCNLVVMYASWLWRKRASGEGMPRMLRYALNNRVIGEKANGR